MGSERQSGGEHLLLQFAGAVDLQCLLEQRLYLTGFRTQHLGQHLRRVAMPGQRRLQVIDLFG
jgi:hypothetical protein